MRAMEYLQLDPLQIIARSQDLSLHSRVANYTPGLWEQPCYRDRKFFDWGGWLAVRPMEELPQWRAIMQREKEHPRWRAFARKHRDAIEEMRGVVRTKGTVSNRDFEMHTRKRVDNYRGRKDSAIALYYLWRTGDVMTHHRERFERVYGPAETIAPPHLLREASEHELEAFLVGKAIAFHGLHRLNALGGAIGHSVKPKAVARMGEKMLAEGELIPGTSPLPKTIQRMLPSRLMAPPPRRIGSYMAHPRKGFPGRLPRPGRSTSSEGGCENLPTEHAC